jgi:hypothetical protein
MKNYLIILLALIFSNSVFGSQVTIYRWVDNNNIVHFSQNHPTKGNYTQLSSSQMKIEKSRINAAAQMKATLEEEANKEEVKDDEKTKCLTAQKNLNTLKNFENIKYKTASGEYKVLTVKEKKAQLMFNKTQIELYCQH